MSNTELETEHSKLPKRAKDWLEESECLPTSCGTEYINLSETKALISDQAVRVEALTKSEQGLVEALEKAQPYLEREWVSRGYGESSPLYAVLSKVCEALKQHNEDKGE